MRNLMHITALAAATFAGAAYGSEHAAGVASFAVTDAQTERPLEGIMWYPAAGSGPTTRVHSNPVWAGVDAAEDAPILEGTYPLVVLSHGMYGNMMNQNWLASELAKQGYIVASVNHPGTSTWLRDPDHARQLWERPRDISRVITHMTRTSEMAAQIDDSRIYMAGHSLGGWTAMALAGATYDADAFDDFCAQGLDLLVCGVMDRWQVAKAEADRAALAQSYADPRISAFAVFDLGGTQTFNASSLGAIEGTFLIMGAPVDGSRLNLDVESRDLVAKLTSADVTYLEPAHLSHFDFMGICTPAAKAILQEEEPDDVIVCEDGITERATDHAMIIDAVTAHFSH